MEWHNKKPPRLRQKKYIMPIVFLVTVVALRLILTPVLLSFINNKLKDKEVSPTLQGHVGSLSLGFIRGAVTMADITAEIRDGDKRFLKVDSVEAGISWKDLFKGDLVADVVVNKPDFTYSEDLLKALKIHAKETKDEDKKKEAPPVRLARVDVKDAVMRLKPYDSLTPINDILMSDIDARITNATPTKELPKTLMTVQAKLLDSGQVKTVGEAELLNEPLRWSVDGELLNFDLTSLNRFLSKKVPLTFTKGKLDFFAEAKSENGAISGYLKPFVKNLDVVRKEEDFQGTKHFLVEIITAISNITVKADNESATRVPFVYDGQMKTDTGDVLLKAFQHGFTQEISKGIENTVNLK